jgi:hypothetical protein
MNRRFMLLVVFLLLTGGTVRPAAQDGRGQITGRVTASDGTPVVGATIRLSPPGKEVPEGQTYTARTDSSGAFTVSDLPARLYEVNVQAGGFVRIPSGQRRIARIGDHLALTISRGGAITGRVTDADGHPLAVVEVTAWRVRDEADRPNQEARAGKAWYTDDRGIYRIFGLPAGIYIVSVGSQGRHLATTFVVDILRGDAPTYHPAASRAGAKEVVVTEGGETTGIDIRHRGIRGMTIRGNIAAQSSEKLETVWLLDAETKVVARETEASLEGRFTFVGIENGTYLVVAHADLETDGSISDPVRVTVQNRDIEDLTVPMFPLGTVVGKIAFTPPSGELAERCGHPDTPLQETQFRLVAATPNPLAGLLSLTLAGNPEDNDTFGIHKIPPGRYALTVTPPAGWYVAAATEPGNPKPLGPVLLKKGATRNGIAVTLEFGAVTVKGSVSNLPKAAEDVERLRVHLVPLDEAQVENTTRYYETTIGPDGGFEFKNLAPGRYAVIVQKKDVPAGENPAFPVALDPAKRKLLRDDAKSAKTIELSPCRPVEGVEVKP